MTVHSTFNWFQQARPRPTQKDIMVQTGVHFEEIGEMLEEMQGQCPSSIRLLREARVAINKLASALKSNSIKYMVKSDLAFLDSLADQYVAGVGVGHAFGYDMPEAYDEVNRSNWSKFDEQGNPVFQANGKIAKHQNYTPPNLVPFI